MRRKERRSLALDSLGIKPIMNPQLLPSRAQPNAAILDGLVDTLSTAIAVLQYSFWRFFHDNANRKYFTY